MYVTMVVSGGGVSAACTVLKNFNWGRMNVGYGHVCFESYVVDEIENGIFVFQRLFMDYSVMLLEKLYILVLFS
jgi:hypothetical protein